MRIAGSALSAIGVAVGLSGCGGGGSDAVPVAISQTEATAVVQHVNGASVVLADTLAIGASAISILASRGPAAASTVLTFPCLSGGTYKVTYRKASSVGYVSVGDAATIEYDACMRFAGGASSYSGTSVVMVTGLSDGSATGALSFAISMSDMRSKYVTTSVNLLNTLNGAFISRLSSNSISVNVGALPLNGTLAGYPDAVGVSNGAYKPSNAAVSQTFSTSGDAHSDAFAFSTTYTSADAVAHPLTLSTVTPVTLFSGSALSVTSAGKFRISGYKGSSINVVNSSISSSTVSVDDGSDGTVELTFSLAGAYLL